MASDSSNLAMTRLNLMISGLVPTTVRTFSFFMLRRLRWFMVEEVENGLDWFRGFSGFRLV